MAQDINHYLAAASSENVSNGLSGPQETHYVNTGMSDVYGLLVLASIGASAYHGFKRNDSVGWGIVWGLLGGIAPVITPAIAVAQGFGEPERHGNPIGGKVRFDLAQMTSPMYEGEEYRQEMVLVDGPDVDGKSLVRFPDGYEMWTALPLKSAVTRRELVPGQDYDTYTDRMRRGGWYK